GIGDLSARHDAHPVGAPDTVRRRTVGAANSLRRRQPRHVPGSHLPLHSSQRRVGRPGERRGQPRARLGSGPLSRRLGAGPLRGRRSAGFSSFSPKKSCRMPPHRRFFVPATILFALTMLGGSCPPPNGFKITCQCLDATTNSAFTATVVEPDSKASRGPAGEF